MRIARPIGLLGAAVLAAILASGLAVGEGLAEAGASAAPARPITDRSFASNPAPLDTNLTALEKAAQEPEAGPAAWVSLGDALMQKSRETMDSALYGRAESAYQKALTLDRANADALVGLAWVHNSEHQFEEGRRWALEALQVNPKLQHAHALLGDAAVEFGDYDSALEHYQEALDIRPDLSSYSRAAHLLWLTGDARKARWLMRKAIDAGGPYAENTAWCRSELARMLWREGALLPAEQQAEKALQQAPDNPHVLATMGLIKTARKDYPAAIQFYERAADIVASHDTLVALGDLYSLTGRHGDAEKQYAKVINLHASGDAHSHGGRVHVHKREEGSAQLARFYADHDRNLDDALREAEAAYLAYKNVFVTDTLAWCYYKKGLLEPARKTITKALRWNTPDASILFHAGMIYEQSGDLDAAQKFFHRALSLNPYFDPRQAEVAATKLKALAARREHASQSRVSAE